MKINDLFGKIPNKYWWKNELRYFLAFNPAIPASIRNISPMRGYELYRQIREGDVVVDAGAYPGDYAVWASRKVGKTGKVICFEPATENLPVLEQNLKREKYKNWIIVPKGLWSHSDFFSISGTGHGVNASLESSEKKMEVVSLDEELQRLGIDHIDVLKMDIEGAEIEAIEGARRTLTSLPVYIAIASYHIVKGKRTAEFLEDYLSKIGYQTTTSYLKHLTTYGWKL